MISAPKFPLLWYNPACPPPDRFLAEGGAAGADPQRKARAAYDPTPKPGPIRGILKSVLRGFASHGRGTRPAWQGRRFALPLHPSRCRPLRGPDGADCAPNLQPGLVPVTTTERPLSRARAALPPTAQEPARPDGGGMAHDVTTHQWLATLPALAADNDPLAEGRLMARAAGFGDRVDLFIIARARGHRIMSEGTA